MSTNISSTEQIVEINAGDQITNVNIVSQSTTQVISGEQVVTIDTNAGTIPAAWGSITGTLSNQTDLQNALNLKQNNITLTTTGSSGAATLVGSTLNIPNYADTGLTSVGLSVPTGLTVSNSPLTSNGTIAVAYASGYVIPTTAKQAQWDAAYNDKINSASVSGTTTKTLTLTQQDGGTVQASWSDIDTGLTSVGISMPSGFNVSGSPLTSNGTISITGAGTTAQYLRGDGTLATFPTLLSSDSLVAEVYNETGATLSKGTIVYINGAHGNLPTVTKGIATGDPTSAQTFGIVQTDITNMNNGYVIVRGKLSDLNTYGLSAGTQLYLSGTTAGTWTTTKPYAPTHLVYVGIVVRDHPTQGVVEVAIQNGFELDELHNVSARFPSNKDGLFYNSTSGLWENKSIAGILGYTPVPQDRIITINGTAQDLSANRTWNVGTVTSVGASAGTGITISGSPVTGSGTITITNSAPDQTVSLTGAGTTSISGTYPNFTVTSNDQYTGTVTNVAASGGTGISISGSPVTGSGTITITNTAPDKTVALTGTGTTTISGTYPNFTINSADQYNGTVTSVAASGGTGISISGSPVTGSGTINIVNTAPDQVVSLTGSGTTSISGTYPNFTITSNDSKVGTVTSVSATVPTGFDVSGVPITSTGTIDIRFSTGYSLPTTAKQTQWDDAYTKRINSLTVTGSSGSSTLVSNVLNVPTYTLAGLGGEPAITAGTSLQYWRGDKTFQTLNTSVVPESGNVYFTEPRVRNTVITGVNITGGSISASDSVLDAFGKLQNQINGLMGGSIFQSTWNAATNSPTLTSSVGTKGYYYIVATAGTTNLNGITDWQVGDWAIFDGTVWRKVDNTDAVVSVNGFTGIVSLNLSNIADVSATSPTGGQLLRFNGTSSKWENWTPTYISAAITSLNSLTGSVQTFSNDTNVTMTSAGTTHTLGWTGNLAVGRGGTGITTYTKGDILYSSATDTLAKLAGNTTTTKKFLNQTGDGTLSAAPSWAALVSADIPNNAADTSGNAATATKLATARTLTIGATGKTFDGSADVTWSASDIGLTSYLPLAGGTMTGNISYNVGNGTDFFIDSSVNGPTIRLRSDGGSTNRLGSLGWKDNSAVRSYALSWYSDASIKLPAYTTNGILKVSGGDGTIGIAVAADFPTFNQNTTGSAATLTTARTLTIGATGKTFDGSADRTWTLAEIGAQAALTNPVTGTGTNGYIVKYSSTGSTVNNSILSQGSNNTISSVFSSASGSQTIAGMFTGQGAASNTGAMFFGAGEPNGIDPSYPNIRAGLKIYQSWTGTATDVKFDLFTLQGGVGNKTVLTGNPDGSASFGSSVTATQLSITGGTANDSGERSITVDGSGTPAASLYLREIWNGTAYPVVIQATKGSVNGNAASDLVVKTSYYNGTSVTTAERFRIQDTGNAVFSGASGEVLKVSGSSTTDNYISVYSGTIQMFLDADNTNSAGIVGTQSNHPVRLRTNGTDKVLITTGGNVVINDTTTTYRFDVNGTGNFRGALSGTSATFSGNVAIGGNSLSAWGATFGVMQSNYGSYFGGTTGGGTVMGNNNYYDGTNYKYINSDFAGQIQIGAGNILLRVAPTGTAGNNITFTNALTIASTGAATFSAVNTISFANTSGSIDNNAYLRLVNTGAATLNQSIDIVMRWQDGTYNGTGGISMVRESATARSGKLILQPIDASGNNVSALTLASTGAATFSSSVNTSGNIQIDATSPLFISNATSTSYYGGVSIRLNGTEKARYASNSTEGAYVYSPTAQWNGFSVLNDATTFFRIASTGAATFSSSVTATNGILSGVAANTYGLSVTANSTTGQSQGIKVLAGTNSSDFSLLVNNQANTSNYLVVRGDGLVGIGTSSPAEKLEVSGNIQTTVSGGDAIVWARNGTVSTYLVSNTTGGSFGLVGTATNHDFLLRTNNTERLRVTNAGRIIINNSGVSNNSGDRNLTIQGSLSSGGSDVASINLTQIWNGTSYPAIISSQVGTSVGVAAADMVFKTSYWNGSAAVTAERMRISENGYVNINNTSNTTYQLFIGGSVGASGGFFDTSDIRVKNIIERNPSLDINVDLVKYTKNGDSKVRYGYIAQEVQSINKDVVEGSDILSLNYSDIHCIKIAALENEIRELKAKLAN